MKCKINDHCCVYHACMSNDCQKEVVLSQGHPGWGSGRCDKIILRREWTNYEIEYMRKFYPDKLASEIAENLGRPLRQIYYKAKQLKISKSDAFKASELSGRLNNKNNVAGINTRFLKGDNPRNKGKKQTEYMSAEGIERSKPNRFKKGHVSANNLYDGAITLRTDQRGCKYHAVRISKKVWIPLKNKVWEDNHGPIPSGHMITYIDGDSLNCDPENLQCISKKQNMERNSIMRFPKEYLPLIHLNAKLKKQIKQYEHNK